MSVVLPGIDLLTVHEDGRDAEVLCFRRWWANPASAVFAAVELRCCDPALFDAFLDVRAEVFVKGISRTVFLVKPSFEVFAGRPLRVDRYQSLMRFFAVRVEVAWGCSLQVLDYLKELASSSDKSLRSGPLGELKHGRTISFGHLYNLSRDAGGSCGNQSG
jgi:hypothetical protein